MKKKEYFGYQLYPERYLNEFNGIFDTSLRLGIYVRECSVRICSCPYLMSYHETTPFYGFLSITNTMEILNELKNIWYECLLSLNLKDLDIFIYYFEFPSNI